MFRPCCQYARQMYYVKLIESNDNVINVTCFGRTVTNGNKIHKYIHSRLNSGRVLRQSIQNIFIVFLFSIYYKNAPEDSNIKKPYVYLLLYIFVELGLSSQCGRQRQFCRYEPCLKTSFF
jgi:hypothetical protein